MKNSESQKFEESWRIAFSDAEADPADRVWANIDLHLSHAESRDMKRSVVFYQRLAAASVIFAISLSGLGIWYSTKDGKQEITETTLTEKNGVKPQELNLKNDKVSERTGNLASDNTRSGLNQIQHSSSGESGEKFVAKSNEGTDLDQPPLAASQDLSGQRSVESISDSIPTTFPLLENRTSESIAKNNNEPRLNESTQSESKVNDEGIKEISATPLFVDAMNKQVESKKKHNIDENWWASLGGAAGSYNPNQGTTTAAPAYLNSVGSSSNYAQQNSRPGMGTSFSFGMNFGKKIAPRLMLMSGFNYLTQSVDYSSNVAMLSANNSAFAADLLSQTSTTALTAPYTINSVSEFVSVPVQAGYLFIDRKLGLQLNAGISTDFFVKNTLDDQSGKLSSYTQNAGDNSLYRTVNWAGLMGTELSYKVAKHYRISVVPGLRYSFNSVIKSNTGTTLNPMIWDIGFRFRYMF